MQSSNPVFRRSAGFNGRGGAAYVGFDGPITHSGYGATSTSTGRMTIDTVVQKTAITLGVTFLAAAATWVLTGNVVSTDQVTGAAVIAGSKAQLLYTLLVVGALGGFVLSMVNSFKRVISPPLVIAYAAFEGLAIGAMSKTFQLAFGGGVVTGAVLGTVAAVGGTLAAYRFFNIRVSDRFRQWVVAAMFGFVAVAVLDMLLSLFKADLGFNGFGGLGLVFSFIGLGLGVLMLILDFDFVEKGIAAGLPEQESWRAAFGLTVTIVWIYIELLRILSMLRNN
jgi:uncharacterized YccA/Bax inhibitor family protein